MILKPIWQRLLLGCSLFIAGLSLLLDTSSSIAGAGILGGVLLVSVLVALVYVFLQRQTLRSAIRDCRAIISRDWLLLLFAVVCSLVLASTMFLSWLYTPMGLQLQGGNLHDSVWHVALIKELQLHVPPLHPSSFQNEVQYYHYYYDLMNAAIANASGISPTFLHFQIMPVLISLFLALSIIGFTRSITTNRRFPFWLLFFVYFGGSAGYLITLVFPTKSWMESSFWVSQTFSMMVNPQLLLSFALLLVLLSIPLWGDLVKSKRLFIAALIILAALAGIKMYAFLTACVLFGLLLAIRSFSRDYKAALVRLLIVIIVAGGMFLRFTDISKQQLIYSPFWFVNTMVEAPDRLFILDWKLREDTYVAEGAWLHYVALKGKEIAVFYGGNLGTRSIFIMLPILLLVQLRKKERISSKVALAMSGATLGFVISTTVPLLFIQTGVVWNTIQFWYYGLIFASILGAYALSILPEVITMRKSMYGAISLIIIGLTIPAWSITMYAKMTTNDLIANGIIEAAHALRPQEKILICSTGLYTNFIFKSSLVRALSNAEVYLADPVQLELIGLNGYQREIEYNVGMQDETWLRNTIDSAQITSIICADEAWNTKMATLLQESGVRIYEP